MGKKKNVALSQKSLMKSEMVAEVFTILMEAYIKSLGRTPSGQRLTITLKSYNRYIKFSGFKEYFDICLYKSGDIDIKVNEFCHGTYIERIFEWSDERKDQDAFLEKLRNGFADQIIEVANCSLVDYHSFMDLLHGDNNFAESYAYFKREFGHCYD